MITELQGSLIAIGSVIVVGVISYNKWHEYKARKSVERAFSSSPDDVLMSAPDKGPQALKERHEPAFLAPAEAADMEAEAEPDGLIAPVEQYGETTEAAAPNMAARELPVDELVDCMIALTLEQPIRGDKVIGPIQNLRHVGNKPVHYIGLRDNAAWEPITHGSVYTALQAGVQLANRTSALNEIEYSELVTRLRSVADELGAEADVPDMTPVMQSARALFQFINEFDAQLSVNIQSNEGPWAISTLLIALEKQGFDLRPEGRLVMPDGDGGVLFSLSTNVTLAADTTTRLTLLLDVARVAQPRNGFGAMIACCRSLAMRMNGTVVDDGNQPLSEQALAEISGQVKEFYANMESAGIPAGSVRALRLFS